jgi:uncharacterized protein (TIGR00369 family)
MTDAHQPPDDAPSSRNNFGRPVHGFRRIVGYETRVWRHRYAEIALAIDGRHDNSHGNVHGGVYCTLLDSAFGHAVAFCGVPGRTRLAVTITLQTTYLAPAKAGLLVAKAWVLDVTGRVATCRGEIWVNETTLCATGQSSFMYMPGSEAPDGVPMSARRAPM